MAWKGWRNTRRSTVPDGLWMQCKGCGQMIYRKAFTEKLKVCPECQYHFSISGWERIEILLDKDSFEEHFEHLVSVDPLNFKAKKRYRDKIESARSKTGLNSAAIVGKGRIGGIPVAFGVTDSNFIMGSMGSVVGEKLTRLIEMATDERLPLLIVSGSGGGARMEEGALSLMQMAKTSAALARHDDAGLLYISILTNATMGGTMASFASLGDINLAEPGALLGFAGPRVIKQTIKKDLPKGFQTSEFLLDRGFLDLIVQRHQLRSTLIALLTYCGYERDEAYRLSEAAGLSSEEPKEEAAQPPEDETQQTGQQEKDV